MKSEKEIEKYLKEKVARKKGLCLKWTSPGTAGVPDRIVISPLGIIQLVELKAEGKKYNLSPVQEAMFRKIGICGRHVFVLSSFKEVDNFVERCI